MSYITLFVVISGRLKVEIIAKQGEFLQKQIDAEIVFLFFSSVRFSVARRGLLFPFFIRVIVAVVTELMGMPSQTHQTTLDASSSTHPHGQLHAILLGLLQPALLIFTIIILIPPLALTRPIVPMFALHPICMVLAVIAFSNGILVQQHKPPGQSPVTAKRRRLAHSIFQTVAFVSLLVGVGFIILHKFNQGKPHLKSPHAILGVVTLCLILIQSLLGSLLYINSTTSSSSSLLLFHLHKWSGYLAFTLCITTAILGASAQPNAYPWYAYAITGITVLEIVLFGLQWRRIRKGKELRIQDSPVAGAPVTSEEKKKWWRQSLRQTAVPKVTRLGTQKRPQSWIRPPQPIGPPRV